MYTRLDSTLATKIHCARYHAGMSNHARASKELNLLVRVGLCLVGLPLVWIAVLGVIYPGAEVMRDSEGIEVAVLGAEPWGLGPAKRLLVGLYGVMLMVDPKAFSSSKGLRLLLFAGPVGLAILMFWIPSAHSGWPDWAQGQSPGVVLLGFLGIITLYSLPALFSAVYGAWGAK